MQTLKVRYWSWRPSWICSSSQRGACWTWHGPPRGDPTTILQNVASSKPLFAKVSCLSSFSCQSALETVSPIISAKSFHRFSLDLQMMLSPSAIRHFELVDYLSRTLPRRAIDLLLPELERGLADNSYRIRLSSVELVGDLLFNLPVSVQTLNRTKSRRVLKRQEHHYWRFLEKKSETKSSLRCISVAAILLAWSVRLQSMFGRLWWPVLEL